MNNAQVHAEIDPILKEKRKNAGLFEPVARGMELSIAQSLRQSVQLTQTNCYEHGFAFKNGRFE